MRSLLPESDKPGAPPAPQTPSTTWINGVRGTASLIIALNHYLYDDFSAPYQGFGSSPENRYFHQLPFVRVVWCGHAVRNMFFVISGYCACWSAIRLRDAREFDRMLDRLSASAFRRGLRLYLPVWLMAALSHLALFCGLYGRDWSAVIPLYPWTRPGAHLRWLARYMVDIANPGVVPQYPSLNVQYWVMPIEFAGSFASYITVLALARAKPRLRPALLAAFILPFVYRGQCFTYTYLCGVLVAELNALRAAGALRVSPLLNRAVFAFGFFLLCLPDNYADTPGYAWLTAVESPAWYAEAPHNWRSIAAILFIFGVSNEPALQKLPNMRFPQAVSKISWEIYLTHVWVYNMWTVPIKAFMMSVFERAGGFWVGYMVTALIMWTLVYLCAKRLKAVNARLMAFAKWFEGKAQDVIL